MKKVRKFREKSAGKVVARSNGQLDDSASAARGGREGQEAWAGRSSSHTVSKGLNEGDFS